MEKDIPISEIHMDRMALRHEVTDESVKSLAESIRAEGLLQAIVVAPRDGGGYRLIAGRRRLTAYKVLGLPEIPARIIEPSHIDEIPALAENLVRLQMNPVEEAEAVKRLHEQKGMSIRDICELTNHGTSWVQDRLFLCTMPDNFKTAVASKVLSISAAGQLLQIHDEVYRDYLLSVATVNGCTIHQAQAWLLDYQARSKIMNPTGMNPIEPRLPMDPPEPTCICHMCDNRVVPHLTNILRFCHPCTDILQQVKKATEPSPVAEHQDIPTPANA